MIARIVKRKQTLLAEIDIQYQETRYLVIGLTLSAGLYLLYSSTSSPRTNSFIPGVPGSHKYLQRLPDLAPNHAGPLEDGKLSNLTRKYIHLTADTTIAPTTTTSSRKTSTYSTFVPRQRLVHLDLKGAPPSVEYIKTFLNVCQQLGATGVLLEWEDMFPWTGRLESAAAANHYTIQQVDDILATCHLLGLDLIPLIQTFGHLEFILKLSTFSEMRDLPSEPCCLCPCHPPARELIKEMIDQILAVHKTSRYLHIGCDEVYSLGECQECGARDQAASRIFIDHVKFVAEYVKSMYNVTPILWDDMLRHLYYHDLKPLGELVQPMVWSYADKVDQYISNLTWHRYASVFQSPIWAASAFKGASGETALIPDIGHHMRNNLAWLKVMSERESQLGGGWAGIVLTGWQRYDHFAVLCELLPVSLPSLAINLLILGKGGLNISLVPSFYSALGCQATESQSLLNLKEPDVSHCDWPGSKVYGLVSQVKDVRRQVEEFLHMLETSHGWFTPYHVRHNLSQPFRVSQIISRLDTLLASVNRLMEVTGLLDQIYQPCTRAEWTEQNLQRLQIKLSKVRREAARLGSIKRWLPRHERLELTESSKSSGSDRRRDSESSTGHQRKVQPPDYYSSKRQWRT